MKSKEEIMEMVDSLKLKFGEDIQINEEKLAESYTSEADQQNSTLVVVFSIIGGILTTIALIGFLFLAEIIKGEISMIVAGTGMLLVSVALRYFYEKPVFIAAFSTFFIAGFILIFMGLTVNMLDWEVSALIIALIALIVWFFTRDFIFTFISIVVFNISLQAALFEAYSVIFNFYFAALTFALMFLILKESYILKLSFLKVNKYLPSLYGIFVSYLISLFVGFSRNIENPGEMLHVQWFSSIVTIPVVLYLMYRILNKLEIQSFYDRIIVIGLGFILMLPTAIMPSLSGALMILLIGFLFNYKSMLATGVLSLLYFLTIYYYDLDVSLLFKSITLISTGIVFLIFYFILIKYIKRKNLLI